MFQSINPATGEAGECIPEFSREDVHFAIHRAETCYRAWRNAPVDRRAALLAAIADQFESNKRHLAEMATREMGKTISGGIAEVEKCVAAFRHFAEHGPSFLEPTRVETSGAMPSRAGCRRGRCWR